MRPTRSPRHRFPLAFLTLVLAAWPAAVLSAAPPPDLFRHAEIHRHGGVGELGPLLRRIEDPAWIGYAVPRVDGGPRVVYHGHDGHEAGCGTLYLEGGKRRGYNSHSDGHGDFVFVLLRAAHGEIVRIRSAAADCKIDVGGLALHWFESIEPAESIGFLVSLGEKHGPLGGNQGGKYSLRDDVLAAVALHDASVPLGGSKGGRDSADRVIERIAAGELDWRHEEEAVFWLGAARGRAGFEALERLRETGDADLREHITFALSISEVPEALEALIRMARHDEHRDVRQQAVFWLGQEASARAVAELERVAEEDPDLEVKKHAIFALSQLPPAEGVPLLIRYARTHPHPEVRRQAMFWLGQSGDERALDFFTEILLE